MTVSGTIFTGTMCRHCLPSDGSSWPPTIFKEEGGLRIRFPPGASEVMSELGKQNLSVTCVAQARLNPGEAGSEVDWPGIGDFPTFPP